MEPNVFVSDPVNLVLLPVLPTRPVVRLVSSSVSEKFLKVDLFHFQQFGNFLLEFLSIFDNSLMEFMEFSVVDIV